jgi:hypothetical protein
MGEQSKERVPRSARAEERDSRNVRVPAVHGKRCIESYRHEKQQQRGQRYDLCSPFGSLCCLDLRMMG